MKWYRKIFNNKTDAKVNAILKSTEKTSQETAVVAKDLHDLLKKNGVTLQIFIATGGDRRVRARH